MVYWYLEKEACFIFTEEGVKGDTSAVAVTTTSGNQILEISNLNSIWDPPESSTK